MTYGIIKNKDGSTYTSPIFALKYAGWKSEAIVFDETFERVKRLKMWTTCTFAQRNIFVLEDDFCDGKCGWAGFDWVLNDKKLLRALRFGRSASIEAFPLFKAYRQKISLPEFFEIETDKDIYALENVCFGFHDAYVREYAETPTEIKIRFDTSWGCYITVVFEGVIQADFKEKVGQILSSEIKKTDEGFLFRVTGGFAGWIDGCDYDAEMGDPYIHSKKIFWQIEIE